MRREIVFALVVAAVLVLQVTEGRRPRSALLPPGKHTLARRSPPPRRAPPPVKAAVPSPKQASSPAVVPAASPTPAPNPSPRATPKQSAPPIALPREGNGVRLVGGSGPRGRLEVSSTDGWLNEYVEGAVAWRPVCNMVGFDDSDAQVMCELMGYTYGRLYYSDEINRRPPNDTATDFDLPIENLDCSPHYAPPTAEVDPAAGGRRRLSSSRALLSSAFELGSVNIPADAPWRCGFSYRYDEKSCDYTGPLVGVECSFQEFPPAPSPPPSPPSPPNAPPDRDDLLRTYGTGMGIYEPLESNLCVPPAADAEDPEAAAEEYDTCTRSSRVELLVADPTGTGGEVAAALCAIDDNEDLALLVADTLCKQIANFPQRNYKGYRSTLLPSLLVPDADPPADAPAPVFKPSAYANKWVTITGGEPYAAYPALQQMEYTVGSSCASGRLFAYSCSYNSR